MNRIDRLSAILVQLQSKKVVTAQEIADRFEISLRTVYRDVRALEEGGVPIGAEAGKGYFIMDGYYLPPVAFTQSEANALVLGAKLIESQTDHSIKSYFAEAMLKIKAVLKANDKERLEKLESQIKISSRQRPEHEDFPNNFLATIQQALIEQTVLRFRYYANYSDDYTTREAEPISLVFYGNRWHLLAYCRLRKAPRDFRADRIVKLEKLPEHFEAFDKKALEKFMQSVVRGTELVEVEIAVNRSMARYISEQKFHQGFVSEKVVEDQIHMKFLAPSLNYFSRWLLSVGDAARIISPKELNGIMLERIQELANHYLAH